MIGPVEREVRALLVEGATRDQVQRQLGGYGVIFFDRMVRRRIAALDGDGRARLNARLLPPTTAALAEARRRHEAEAARRAAESEAVRRRIEEQEAARRQLAAQLARARTPDEARRIAYESRVLAMAERAVLKINARPTHFDRAQLEARFGIEFER